MTADRSARTEQVSHAGIATVAAATAVGPLEFDPRSGVFEPDAVTARCREGVVGRLEVRDADGIVIGTAGPAGYGTARCHRPALQSVSGERGGRDPL